ncbi:tumor necrosis factor ligand superfamily member 18 [Danio rerio]|uniref:Tumor necrosis factor ligand superfamily member 18 n=1 Tax=Danio rerio TaxID=7955 RepID=A9Y5K7_DANRE|nr:tumor necrosis factor ligand superfamily member 18 [Danio rerio]ABV22578.1 tumor necrosis factor ligand superfamily member 18 [Danio rerio]|eukprot:NP_001122290.1 TNF superfamily member 18 [Danio rerio]
MSLSAEHCRDTSGDRGGGGGFNGALIHQRTLIRGLIIWVTLLTLGLAASISLHFIPKESPAPSKQQGSETTSNNVYPGKKIDLMTFTPNWENTDVELLQWNTVEERFIKGEGQLTVTQGGAYFLYLQVTLDSRKKENHTITVQTQKQNVILKGYINGSNLSSGFLATGIYLDDDDTFNVTCKPKAKIQNSHIETYMGVIKLG